MASYNYVEVQTVQPGIAALLNDGLPCKRGYVIHRSGSGILTLRGIVNNPCSNFARYHVSFDGNIAVPEGGTAGEIQLGLAIGGEIIPTSIGAATPTVVDAYWNVCGSTTIDVPAGCCYTVSVENASIATGTTIPALNVRNLNVEVNRLA